MQRPGVPYFFDHSVAFVSNSTYQAFQNSTWLRDVFSSLTVDTQTTPEQPSVTQQFERTSLMFFQEGAFGFPPGMTGFGFTSESPGGLKLATHALETSLGKDNVSPYTETTSVHGRAATVRGSEMAFSGPFFSWVNETSTDSSPNIPLTRTEMVNEDYAPAKLASNLVAIGLALGPEDSGRFEQVLRAVGWSVERHEAYFAGHSPLDGGSRRSVIVEPAVGSRRGMSVAVIALNRYTSHDEQLGDARLMVGVRGKNVAVLRIHPSAGNEAIEREIDGL
ncbi:DUF5829 family protein [Pendulispora rubella]|uniref:DUF5829 family protein n=1 Tax=Pendulispora rubella TaxID=2741070 RepID=UPI0030E47F7D